MRDAGSQGVVRALAGVMVEGMPRPRAGHSPFESLRVIGIANRPYDGVWGGRGVVPCGGVRSQGDARITKEGAGMTIMVGMGTVREE